MSRVSPTVRVSLGIDTGGTYTDAVLYDANKGVIAAAKSLTTRHNLFEGIRGAASDVLGQVPDAQVTLVSVSTTLATNAVVEGVRRPIALVLAGFDERALARHGLGKALGGDPVAYVGGGHNADGKPKAALDLSGLDNLDLTSVGAVAVVGRFAVRNREHELELGDHLSGICDLPITCSHELSAKLDGPMRAVTTLFNARLIPHIGDLLKALSAFLSEQKITAPVMVVQGDGSLVAAEAAKARPIDTVLSGPAASLVGAQHLLADSINTVAVSDMGGTTTDIGFIIEGKPRIATDGALVGGFRTHVEAVDMVTAGVGGDSEISVETGVMTVGPRRAEPLCVAAERWPSILTSLRLQLDDLKADRANARFIRRLVDHANISGLNRFEAELWHELKDGPLALRDLDRAYGSKQAITSLVERGLAIIITFTPTDASHILGNQQTNNREAAQLGADLLRLPKELVGWPGVPDAEAFSHLALDHLDRRLLDAHLDCLLSVSSLGSSEVKPAARDLIEGRRVSPFLELTARLPMPLAGVGAPAKLYYPNLADSLNCALEAPRHADVCNAVGAVAGQVRRRCEILISSPVDGVYRVHLDSGFQDIAGDLDEARELAQTNALAAAKLLAQEAGAETIEVSHYWTDQIIENGSSRPTFLSATITVEATGRPSF